MFYAILTLYLLRYIAALSDGPKLRFHYSAHLKTEQILENRLLL
jgi:hypothetical protein